MRLSHLLSLPLPTAPDAPDPGWPAFAADALAAQAGSPSTLDQAACAGRVADRLGYAFGAGYQAGLRLLLGEPPESRLCASLAYTETGGPHPRNVRATLAPDPDAPMFRLSGEKSFATLAPYADFFIIVARMAVPPPPDAPSDAPPVLRLIRLPPDTPGLTMDARPPFPLAPELPHSRLRLDDCRIAPGDILPGDGYLSYIKPFRMIEDTHVLAAVLGYLLRESLRLGWEAPHTGRILGALATLSGLIADLHHPAAHLAFDDLQSRLDPWFDALPWGDALPSVDAAARWERDRPLLGLAAAAQISRRDAARDRIRLIQPARF